MITAIFKKSSNKILSVNLSGHAESADEGFDMVCSAVSAVSLTMANGITEVLHIKPAISVHDGFLSIDASKLSTDDIDKCQVLLETMLIGIKSIEINYGDYIRVRVEEV